MNWKLRIIVIISAGLVFFSLSTLIAFAAASGTCPALTGQTTPRNGATIDEGRINFDMTATDSDHYTWSACSKNVGTLAVPDYRLSGWGWNENLGWINFFCGEEAGVPPVYDPLAPTERIYTSEKKICGKQKYGVKIGGNGALQGWAYSDLVGWISMSCSGGFNDGSSCGVVNYGVKVDENGDVLDSDKYAWSDVLGWINFSGVEFPYYQPSDPPKYDACIDKDFDGYKAGSTKMCASGEDMEGGDCNDNDASIYPGATELCDFKDNDCDLLTDEVLKCAPPDPGVVCVDADSDGYKSGVTVPLCIGGGGMTGGDCNDTDVAINPAATEICDTKDNDCDSLVDEGCLGGPADPGPGSGSGGVGTLPGVPAGCPSMLPNCNIEPADDPEDAAITAALDNVFFPVFPDDIPGSPIIDISDQIIVQGTVSANHSGLSGYQSVGKADGSLRIVKNSIRKNVVQLSKSLQASTETDIADDVFDDKKVHFIDGRYINGNGYYPMIADAGLTLNFNGKKSLVISGADLFIRGDIYGNADTVGKLGIIVLKDIYTGKGGNIYIYKTVKNIQANVFAEGVVFAYDYAACSIYDKHDKYLLGISQYYGQPLWKHGYNAGEQWNNQLFIQGSLISSNILGIADDVVANNSYPLPNNSTTTNKSQARLYDFAYLRFGPISCEGSNYSKGLGNCEPQSPDAMKEVHPIVIHYTAPKGLPGFDVGSGSKGGFGGY